MDRIRDLNCSHTALVIDRSFYAVGNLEVTILVSITKRVAPLPLTDSNVLKSCDPEKCFNENVAHESSNESEPLELLCCDHSKILFIVMCFNSIIPVLLRTLSVLRNWITVSLVSSKNAVKHEETLCCRI